MLSREAMLRKLHLHDEYYRRREERDSGQEDNIDTTSLLGQELFTIASAVAQLERDLIRERVKAGLRLAKAKGTVLGRPRVAVDARAVVKLCSQGHSWTEVSRRLNLSRGTACEKDDGTVIST